MNLVAQWHPEKAPYLDGDTVRDHLQTLMKAGMGWRRIADVSKVSKSTIHGVLYGKYPGNPAHPEHRPPRRKVRRDIATKLLLVELSRANGATLDSASTRRRLRELLDLGWTHTNLAARLGMSPSNFGALLTRSRVTKATARAVQALHNQLRDTSPTQKRAQSKPAIGA
ncbi:hypothetical protein [Propionicimonas sp.]|uniref:hypothetical protein n=1 Tax=Propionicimonas sp. TaxID=1955623 RepID=UPI0017A150F7|nr:hypothetical protein [Propionicimonas sp.]MBA3019678.1 hypothetical protein [Propionicimonas sp.]MBU4207977.1 hypothetical protein [Actinomycetota bacterium]MBU4411485.1 hypothetical protein [Actinomycetota bacterium]MCG2805796.1 hypothetical protein [Propionicimonas sp.]